MRSVVHEVQTGLNTGTLIRGNEYPAASGFVYQQERLSTASSERIGANNSCLEVLDEDFAETVVCDG